MLKIAGPTRSQEKTRKDSLSSAFRESEVMTTP